MADYIYMMESRLTPEQQRGVALVVEIARAHDMNVYLAGGAVRDIISGFQIRDVDIVVQGNPFKLQKDLEKSGVLTQGTDEHTRTLYVKLPGYVRGEISMARSEAYDKPGKLPIVAQATITEDLRRRDFTMNAMALSLNPGSRGLLLDPFNGVADIEAKHVRILHNYAFLEDPSRMVRAVRFMHRFHWEMEERTRARYESAKENEYIDSISDRARGYEIEQLVGEDNPLDMMKHLEQAGYMKVLEPHWTPGKVDQKGLEKLMAMRQQLSDLGYTVDTSAAALYFMTGKLGDKETGWIQKHIPRRGLIDQWKGLEKDAKDFAARLTAKDLAQNSDIWKLLESTDPALIAFTATTVKQSAVDQRIQSWLTKWREIRTRLPLPEFAELRIIQELPDYNKIMERTFFMLMDNKLRTHEEIVEFLKPYSPPEPVVHHPVRRGRAKKADAKGAKGQAKAAKPAAVKAAPQADAAKAALKPDAAKSPAKPPAKPDAAKAAVAGAGNRPAATRTGPPAVKETAAAPKAPQQPAKGESGMAKKSTGAAKASNKTAAKASGKKPPAKTTEKLSAAKMPAKPAAKTPAKSAAKKAPAKKAAKPAPRAMSRPAPKPAAKKAAPAKKAAGTLTRIAKAVGRAAGTVTKAVAGSKPAKKAGKRR